jgi:hypothetical protein
MNETNNYIAPKGNYKLIIKDRNSGEEIMAMESEDKRELLQVMEQYGEKNFSFLLTGNDIALSQQ